MIAEISDRVRETADAPDLSEFEVFERELERTEREREVVERDIDWGPSARRSRLSRMRDRSSTTPNFARPASFVTAED